MERKTTMKRFSPFENYTFKDTPSDANGGRGVYIPKYETGR